MAFEKFVIDMLDAAGNIVGPGPLYNILNVVTVEELDRAGSMTVEVPASDDRVYDYIQNEYQMVLRTNYNATIARGIVKSIEKIAPESGGIPIWRMSGPDLLGELMNLTTGTDNTYDTLDVSAQIIGTNATATSLLGGTGWTQGTVTIDAADATQTVRFKNQTRLNALIALAQQMGYHFRQGGTARTLDFGVFGADSGVRATSPAASDNHGGSGYYEKSSIDASNAVRGYISSVQLSDSISTELANRIFPQGKSGFDMRDAPSALSDILVRANPGPLGYTTTADGNTSGATIPCAATTGFVVGEYVWIGDADDWTADHEYGVIDSISAGVSITLVDDLTNSYTSGADVLQRPEFYVESAASQASYGVREDVRQYQWIGPAQTSTGEVEQEGAATTLYFAAQADLVRYANPYQSYTLGRVFGFPISVRVGQKIRVVYKGTTSYFGGESWLDIDADLYVMKITRTFSANDGAWANVIVSNTGMPAPNNKSLVIFNLDTLRWFGGGL
jgi:hypothetical protein